MDRNAPPAINNNTNKAVAAAGRALKLRRGNVNGENQNIISKSRIIDEKWAPPRPLRLSWSVQETTPLLRLSRRRYRPLHLLKEEAEEWVE